MSEACLKIAGMNFQTRFAAVCAERAPLARSAIFRAADGEQRIRQSFNNNFRRR